MIFDLERAKKEGCIFVFPSPDEDVEEYSARIICDNLKGDRPLGVAVERPKPADEVVYAMYSDGTYPGSYLKNKPQKLEVRIYKNQYGKHFASIEDERTVNATVSGPSVLVKTIEVEI